MEGYSAYLNVYRLETFRLLHDLHTVLVTLHKQRIEVARAWLTLHYSGPL